MKASSPKPALRERQVFLRALLPGLVAVLAALWAPSASAQASSHCDDNAGLHSGHNLPKLPPDGNDTVRVLSKGTWFSIPRSYFAYPPDECGRDKPMVLRVMLPGYLPVTSERAAAPSSVGPGGWGDAIQFIYGHVPRGNLNRAFEIYTERQVDPNGPHERAHGLRVVSFEVPFARGDWTGKFDVFFNIDDGVVTSFILCHQRTPGIERGCRYWFLYRGHALQIRFDRRRLEDWVKIQAGVSELLDRFLLERS
jgi:hypothetical protein